MRPEGLEEWAAAAACEICNLHCDPSLPKPEQYFRILTCILAAMRAARADLHARYIPSNN